LATGKKVADMDDEQLSSLIRGAYQDKTFPEDLEQVQEEVREVQREGSGAVSRELIPAHEQEPPRSQLELEVELRRLDTELLRLELERQDHVQQRELEVHLAREQATLRRQELKLTYRQSRLQAEFNQEREREKHRRRLASLVLAALVWTTSLTAPVMTGSALVAIVVMVIASIVVGLLLLPDVAPVIRSWRDERHREGPVRAARRARAARKARAQRHPIDR
jgi:hypothetical protein